MDRMAVFLALVLLSCAVSTSADTFAPPVEIPDTSAYPYIVFASVPVNSRMYLMLMISNRWAIGAPSIGDIADEDITMISGNPYGSHKTHNITRRYHNDFVSMIKVCQHFEGKTPGIHISGLFDFSTPGLSTIIITKLMDKKFYKFENITTQVDADCDAQHPAYEPPEMTCTGVDLNYLIKPYFAAAPGLSNANGIMIIDNKPVAITRAVTSSSSTGKMTKPWMLFKIEPQKDELIANGDVDFP